MKRAALLLLVLGLLAYLRRARVEPRADFREWQGYGDDWASEPAITFAGGGG